MPLYISECTIEIFEYYAKHDISQLLDKWNNMHPHPHTVEQVISKSHGLTTTETSMVMIYSDLPEVRSQEYMDDIESASEN